ncbi:MAG: hypothetical protein Fur0046_38190 [Cyanobacteria bacterium J069]|nr:MAG: hypothetical protein D6742_03175 [Cyanobacteria bacterium J069]
MVNKARRELFHLPVVSTAIALNYEIKKTRHLPALPSLSEQDGLILDEIRQTGVYMTNINQMDIPHTSAMLATAEQFFRNPAPFFIDPQRQSIPNRILQQYPDLYLWGLEERLLALVENYLALPVLYLGAEVKIETANGLSAGVRQWHVDIEDRRMIKIILYLNDVELDGGPFEYIPVDETQIFVQTTGYRAGLIEDEVMSRSVPPSRWIACWGQKYTVVITDPCRVLHRVKVPSQRDRHSVTFNYCSRFPFEFRSKHALKCNAEVLARLSARQLACAIRES